MRLSRRREGDGMTRKGAPDRDRTRSADVRAIASPPAPAPPRRSPGRAPFLAGMGISALAHLVVIFVYPFFAPRPPAAPGVLVRPAVREVAGMRALEIVEISLPDSGDPQDPEALIDPQEPEVEFGGDPEERFEVYIPGRVRTPGERLILGQGDPRLWQPLDPALVAPTPDEIMRLRVYAAIEAANDSAFAEAERTAASLDWTRTDDEGRKWGVSPGRIHLGDVEIPLPFGFGPPPDYNGDQAEWAFRMADIDRAAGTLAARMTWKERIEAMRIRREARRAEEEAARSENPPVVRPDTSTIRKRRR